MAEATLETVIFFEKKISITPKELNELKTKPLDEMILKKAKDMVENKCSEHGFILPGSVALISRSMGYFESARFTGDSNYYVKLQGKVLYPVDGLHLTGIVIRRNKMGLYVNYNDAIHIQVPRDLHINDLAYDDVQIGDSVVIELKRSKFAINDPFILSSGQFISKEGALPSMNNKAEPEVDAEVEVEQEAEAEPEVEAEAEPEVEAEAEPEAEQEPVVEAEQEPEVEEKSEETAPPMIEPVRVSVPPKVVRKPITKVPAVKDEEPVAVKEGGAKKRRSKAKEM